MTEPEDLELEPMPEGVEEPPPLTRTMSVVRWILFGGMCLFALVMGFPTLRLKGPYFALAMPLKRRLLLAFCFGLGVLAGIATTSGFWLHKLWTQFGSPLFPYFNSFFQSPMASLSDYRDARFLPRDIIDVLLFPFYALVAPERTAEVSFRDGRLGLVYFLTAMLGARWLVTRWRTRQRPEGATPDETAIRSKQLFTLLAGLISYAAWLKLFGIYRYLIPLEMLAPLGIWILLRKLVSPAHFRWLAVTCLAVLLLTTKHMNWDRVAWSGDYFGVQPPVLAEPANTQVLMTGYEPTAYFIPFFPPEVRFLRIHSYFTGPAAPPNGSDLLMQRLVAEHTGPRFVLFRSYEGQAAEDALKAYGLTLDKNDCQTLATTIDPLPAKHPLLFCGVKGSGTQGKSNRR